MLVYKFGGASVKDADGIRNLTDIISKEKGNLLVVISAMGKMTNAFEILLEAYLSKQDFSKALQFIVHYHQKIIKDLNIDACLFDEYLSLLETELKQEPTSDYNYEYDKIIAYGELFSTIIVWLYVRQVMGQTKWIDVRDIIKTDSNFRFSRVNWQETQSKTLGTINFSKHRIYLTQGFIASDSKNRTTTLGREGSDYSAAILSYILSAKSITIWKDVEGVLTADPSLFETPSLLQQLSFYDAIELAFFGAKIIHPKTIQPLRNKKIPLYVKSFLEPDKQGTLVSKQKVNIQTPIVIIKDNQVLFSITTRDFSFVDEKNISSIFAILSEYNAKVNMMQNGAVSFSLVVDYMPKMFNGLLEKLSADFDVRYNLNLKLITIRHYTKEKVAELLGEQKIYLEQKSRNTAQYLVDSKH